MVPGVQSTNEQGKALVHHFIRLFGRAPNTRELTRHERARARVALRRRGLRRRAARLIVRL